MNTASTLGAPIGVANVSAGNQINPGHPSWRDYSETTFRADRLAYDWGIVPVFASGNGYNGNIWGWHNSIESAGFNVLGVAHMDHRNRKIAQGAPTRTTPWGVSKPDLYAPGVEVEIFSSVSSGAGERTGSSYAAPMVSGGIASLLSTQTWLKDQPYRVRAKALAGSITELQEVQYRENNREGYSFNAMADTNSRTLVGSSPNWFRDNRHGWMWGKPYYDQHLYFNKDVPVNFAIAWDVDPTFSLTKAVNGSSRVIGQDFDLVVYDPSGKWVTSSRLLGDSKEMVRFTPKANGRYKFRIIQMSKDDWDGETRLGIAWLSNATLK